MRFNEKAKNGDMLAATCSKCGRKVYFPRKGMVWWQRAEFLHNLVDLGWTVNAMVPELTECPECKKEMKE